MKKQKFTLRCNVIYRFVCATNDIVERNEVLEQNAEINLKIPYASIAYFWQSVEFNKGIDITSLDDFFGEPKTNMVS